MSFKGDSRKRCLLGDSCNQADLIPVIVFSEVVKN